jgi:hypothetical protein
MPLLMHSNDGLVLNSNNLYEGIDFHEKIFYKLNDGKDSFVSFTFEGTAFSTVYYRKYVKFQTIITQIGGFLKVISSIATLISNLFSENYYFFFYFANIYPKGPIKKTIKFKEIHVPVTQPASKNVSELNNSPDIRNSKSLISHNLNNKTSLSPTRNKICNFPEIMTDSFKLHISVNSPAIKGRSLKIYVDSPKKLESRLFEFLYTKIFFCKKVNSISTQINKEILALYKQNTSVDHIMLNSYRLEEYARKMGFKEMELEQNYPLWLEEKIKQKIKYIEY